MERLAGARRCQSVPTELVRRLLSCTRDSMNLRRHASKLSVLLLGLSACSEGSQGAQSTAPDADAGPTCESIPAKPIVLFDLTPALGAGGAPPDGEGGGGAEPTTSGCTEAEASSP